MPVKTTKSEVKETSARIIRRENTLDRLKDQLVTGRKPFATKQAAHTELIDYKEEGVRGASSKLNADDVKRIKKEISILEGKI